MSARKKYADLDTVALAEAASGLPPTSSAPPVANQSASNPVSSLKPKAMAEEPVEQISLRLRKSVKKQLKRLADEADVTQQVFILMALQKAGIVLTENDLKDRRKER
jgi:hypothetical protein